MDSVHGRAPRGPTDGQMPFEISTHGLKSLPELSLADLAVLFSEGCDRPAVEPAHKLHLNIGEQHEDAAAEERNGHCGPGLTCLLYTSPSPRDNLPSRMPSSA